MITDSYLVADRDSSIGYPVGYVENQPWDQEKSWWVCVWFNRLWRFRGYLKLDFASEPDHEGVHESVKASNGAL
jgi:hypothetical protein